MSSVGGRYIDRSTSDIDFENDESNHEVSQSNNSIEEDESNYVSKRAAILGAELVSSVARMDQFYMENSNPYHAEIVANARKVLEKTVATNTL